MTAGALQVVPLSSETTPMIAFDGGLVGVWTRRHAVKTRRDVEFSGLAMAAPLAGCVPTLSCFGLVKVAPQLSERTYISCASVSVESTNTE